MSNKKAELWVSPTVWARIVNCRDNAKTEVGFMGIATDPKYPLYIDDLYMPIQECTACTVEFDPDDIGEWVTKMTMEADDEGNFKFSNDQLMRVWFHTHPGNSASPSGTDEDTFKDDFGSYPWAAMAIVAMNDSTSCKLRVATAVGDMINEIPFRVDWYNDFPASDVDAWLKDMEDKVMEKKYLYTAKKVDYTPANAYISTPSFGNGWSNDQTIWPSIDDMDIKSMSEENIRELMEEALDENQMDIYGQLQDELWERIESRYDSTSYASTNIEELNNDDYNASE